MMLPPNLIQQGFSIENVVADDLPSYIQVIRVCFKKYVDENHDLYGVWVDENVVNEFNDKTERTFFRKLLLDHETVGFFAYDVKDDKIDGVSINLIEKARNNGIGSLYLTHIITLAGEQGKPIFLEVMKANPAVHLYTRFGFKHHEDLLGFYQMLYNPAIPF
ncbi:MAG: GNAT family N-acetyltransferase [Defluviitaleaceae bacterium]|nr:GNAT family N-acetyltransferase [Defluviitaleaceae bacterium]